MGKVMKKKLRTWGSSEPSSVAPFALPANHPQSGFSSVGHFEWGAHQTRSLKDAIERLGVPLDRPIWASGHVDLGFTHTCYFFAQTFACVLKPSWQINQFVLDCWSLSKCFNAPGSTGQLAITGFPTSASSPRWALGNSGVYET